MKIHFRIRRLATGQTRAQQLQADHSIVGRCHRTDQLQPVPGRFRRPRNYFHRDAAASIHKRRNHCRAARLSRVVLSDAAKHRVCCLRRDGKAGENEFGLKPLNHLSHQLRPTINKTRIHLHKLRARREFIRRICAAHNSADADDR